MTSILLSLRDRALARKPVRLVQWNRNGAPQPSFEGICAGMTPLGYWRIKDARIVLAEDHSEPLEGDILVDRRDVAFIQVVQAVSS